jgi:uncharacterized protein YjdB
MLLSRRGTRRAATFLFVLLASLSAHAASDVVTVGSVTASGASVDVPISIRDVAGTPLGVDQPAGSRIQSLSIKVTYSPTSAVQSISIARAGITANLSPTSEFKPTTSNSVSLVTTFQESNNAIPFTLNAPAPGNLVAHLVVTLSPSAAPGSTISLTLDSSLTQLTDAGGTAATKETSANGLLSLVHGQIAVPQLSVSVSPGSRTISLGGTGNLSAVLSSAATSDTTVNLSSNNTSVATVPSSVVIPAGSSIGTFKVTAQAVGTARITATLGSSTGISNITVSDEPDCTKPNPPQLSAPSSVEAGATYNVTWSSVTSATEYAIEEATDEGFANPATQAVNGTTASFTHATGGTRYYYRMRARNHAAPCDVFSNYSTVVSVLVTAAPIPLQRVLAVAGSLQGNFGSFFRTSLQLFNPYEDAVSGKLVFHPAGVSGKPSDPTFPYAVAPGKTLAFADILPAMGIAGGLGTIDMVADGASLLPISLARVFNDAGALGTTGLAEEALGAEDALSGGNTGVLFAPADVAKFRLNIGVRSLEQGATISITVRDKEGAIVKTRTRSYEPTFFEQASSAVLLEGFVLTGGETISFQVTSGSAIIYGATTDNTTNDPSVQFARRVQ